MTATADVQQQLLPVAVAVLPQGRASASATLCSSTLAGAMPAAPAMQDCRGAVAVVAAVGPHMATLMLDRAHTVAAGPGAGAAAVATGVAMVVAGTAVEVVGVAGVASAAVVDGVRVAVRALGVAVTPAVVAGAALVVGVLAGVGAAVLV